MRGVCGVPFLSEDVRSHFRTTCFSIAWGSPKMQGNLAEICSQKQRQTCYQVFIMSLRFEPGWAGSLKIAMGARVEMSSPSILHHLPSVYKVAKLFEKTNSGTPEKRHNYTLIIQNSNCTSWNILQICLLWQDLDLRSIRDASTCSRMLAVPHCSPLFQISRYFLALQFPKQQETGSGIGTNYLERNNAKPNDIPCILGVSIAMSNVAKQDLSQNSKTIKQMAWGILPAAWNNESCRNLCCVWTFLIPSHCLRDRFPIALLSPENPNSTTVTEDSKLGTK